MSLVLGIDTGGTYTDGVVVDRTDKSIIAKAKSLTTRDDLSRGIIDCINRMQFDDFSKITVVSLSTTLATNAIVEDRGCEVGVLMIGFEPKDDLPVKEVRIINGGHNVKGKEKMPFDEAAAREAIESMRGKVDAIAVSSYLSVRNPEHELRAQKLITEILDLPVVCAHHLTRSLGMHERTVTAVLNARLIPIIKELLVSVQKVLDEKKITAAVMIVKGDGSLMGEDQAKDKPIETLLSGPASSIIGATFLSGEDSALVLDMGGTTTDIAIIKNGVPRIDDRGAKVGGWLTRVEAAAINTFGLGGDSYIQLDMARRFAVGPQRVYPFCLVATQYPYLIDELLSVNLPYSYLLLHNQVTDCFMVLNEHVTTTLTEKEQQIVDLLRDGPHSYFYISQQLHIDLNILNLNRLVVLGVLGRISVTPTDILHARGDYSQWDNHAAEVAVTLLAKRFKMEFKQFIDYAVDKITDELSYTCLQSLSDYEGNEFDMKGDVASFFMRKQLHSDDSDFLVCKLSPRIPVIGIGAPVAAWLPPMAEKLNARLVIPENPEVANAIGSATGRVMESVKILIHPGDYSVGYVLHSSWEMKDFDDLEAAVAYGKEYAERKAREAAANDGATNIEVVLHHEDVYAESGMIENDIYIESRIEAVATERPEWEREDEMEKFFVDTIDRGMTLRH